MAEIAVSLVIDQLLPLLTKEVKLLRGIHKEFADIKDELECIQAFLKDADKRASTAEGVKTWVKQVREAAFRIEDVIDEYMIQLKVEQQPRCVPIFQKIAHLLKTIIPRHQIPSEILAIKLSICEIKERSERYGFQRSLDQGSSSYRRSPSAKWHDPRLGALYIEESEFVGFEEPRKRLIDWMVKGRGERTVVSVVGMGGQGKTTLAKKVFDSQDVVRHFDCRVWITVSQSYNAEDLLREMLKKFCKEKGDNTHRDISQMDRASLTEEGDNAPRDISQMDRASLTDEVRKYLQQKRYVVMFDDVWDVHFWDDIEFAAIDNKRGSRIFITTRNLDVVMSCKKSSFVELLELQALTHEQSLELFNKKAFQFDSHGRCPEELSDIANEIVQKCKGLPLAIVAIGGLLSTRDKNVAEWQRFRENLSFELKKDTHLIGIKEILGLSYDDLPYYLKPCLLYFGIYPEDYLVRSKRVIRQWIAEGFVKEESGKTLEEVAQGYLTELIHRSLVQVSSLRIDGKVKRCRVHDLIHDMILEKNEDLNFCKHVSDDGQSNLSGIVRRLLVTTELRAGLDDLNLHIERSHVRSLFFFKNDVSASTDSWIIPIKFRLLKVLDPEGMPYLHPFPEFGNLIHLKYLHLELRGVTELSKSIGMLQNLETLEVRVTGTVFSLVLPKEISKLRKLRHLIGDEMCFEELQNGIGEMTSLQTLRNAITIGFRVAEVIKGLGKLKQMRDLGLINVHPDDESILSSSINEMRHLEKLNVFSLHFGIHLNLISPPTMLQKVTLEGCLEKLPEWIPELQNLVVLSLRWSKLTKDPMQSLKSLQHLLILSLKGNAYIGVCLHFEDGGFQKLKELYVENLNNLRDIIINKGALPSLKKLQLRTLPELENLPKGILHLEKLEVLNIQHNRYDGERKTYTEDLSWITEQMPTVKINDYAT
ncbi:disease resistance protein RPM1-like [Vicia villosa]|uniref:disease resistance protein RPM1-like n=1 Tax=Vicia villosa TaxID=3911 RepID=UPI00273B29AC|nr:disease resistance protein RPM1-like [Vicia villosa]